MAALSLILSCCHRRSSTSCAQVETRRGRRQAGLADSRRGGTELPGHVETRAPELATLSGALASSSLAAPGPSGLSAAQRHVLSNVISATDREPPGPHLSSLTVSVTVRLARRVVRGRSSPILPLSLLHAKQLACPLVASSPPRWPASPLEPRSIRRGVQCTVLTSRPTPGCRLAAGGGGSQRTRPGSRVGRSPLIPPTAGATDSHSWGH